MPHPSARLDPPRRRLTRVAVPLLATAAVLLSACSSSSDAKPAAAVTKGGDAVFGQPKAASGSPVVFGTLVMESGPIAFKEALPAAEAAVSYVNAYRGGIGGHPLKLEHCVTDATPATSARCANQLLDLKPTAIMGNIDIGVPAAMAVWQRANLAYIGGLTLTPVEQNSPVAVQFSSVSVADNAEASVYAAQSLKAKSVAVVSGDDPQDQDIVNTRVIPVLKAAGVTKVTPVTYPLTAADLTSQMATAIASKPDVIFLASVSACVNAFRALKTLGNTAKITGISQCASEDVLKAAAGAAEGYYFATPYQAPDTDSPDAALYRAVMAKYAPTAQLTSVAATAFSTVMNAQAALADKDPSTLTTASILAAFRDGAQHPNFLTHPYTCDGKQLAKATAVCDAHQLMYKVKGDKILPVNGLTYVTPGTYYTG